MLCGTLALVGIAAERVVADQAGQASLVRVYLAPDATSDAVAALKAKLRADSRVGSVTELTPAQALAEASKRPGLDNLSSLSSANPFPASLDVRVRMVTQVAAVASSVKGDPAVDASYPTSYDPDTYSRLRHITLVAGSIDGWAVWEPYVSYATLKDNARVVANGEGLTPTITFIVASDQAIATKRAAVQDLAAAVVAAAYLLAVRFESAIYVQMLPGVGATEVQYVLAAVITAGLVLGTATAFLGFRKARE